MSVQVSEQRELFEQNSVSWNKGYFIEIRTEKTSQVLKQSSHPLDVFTMDSKMTAMPMFPANNTTAQLHSFSESSHSELKLEI